MGSCTQAASLRRLGNKMLEVTSPDGHSGATNKASVVVYSSLLAFLDYLVVTSAQRTAVDVDRSTANAEENFSKSISSSSAWIRV